MFTKFVDWSIFLASFVVGLVFIWLSAPESTIVYVYPTPDNIAEFGYIDKAKNCFEYIVKKMTCPEDSSKIKTIPVQMGGSLQKIPTTSVPFGDTNVNKI